MISAQNDNTSKSNNKFNTKQTNDWHANVCHSKMIRFNGFYKLQFKVATQNEKINAVDSGETEHHQQFIIWMNLIRWRSLIRSFNTDHWTNPIEMRINCYLNLNSLSTLFSFLLILKLPIFVLLLLNVYLKVDSVFSMW